MNRKYVIVIYIDGYSAGRQYDRIDKERRCNGILEMTLKLNDMLIDFNFFLDNQAADREAGFYDFTQKPDPVTDKLDIMQI